MPLKVGFISLGCAKNLVDTEIMMGCLAGTGYIITQPDQSAEVVIVNTCGFIEPAREEAVNAILQASRLKKEGSLKILLVAGCLAQRFGAELLAEIPEVDGVWGTGEVKRAAGLVQRALAGERFNAVGNPGFTYDEVLPRVQATPPHYAYLKIAEGCGNRCTYCAIPDIRGGYRSRPMEILEEEAALLAAGGVKEIILVAQDTTAYGQDIYGRRCLAELLFKLCGSGIPWIRVMYCYPTGFTPQLVEVMAAKENICKYVDLPLQHISDRMLSSMNRRGSGTDIRRLVAWLRSDIPGLTLRTTFMVGFPGEGEGEFEELLEFVEETRFDRAGAFKYSPEEGTAAAVMGDPVPGEVKEERYHRLMQLQAKISLNANRALVGKTLEVMAEGRKNPRSNLYTGRTRGDAPGVDGVVLFSAGSKSIVPGDLLDVRITRAFEYGLRGIAAYRE